MVKKRLITAEDLYNFESIKSFSLSPNGEYVVYSVERVDKESEKKFSNLLVFNFSSKKTVQFTYGDQVDTEPVWRPDSKGFIFLSNRKNGKEMNLYYININGGEAREVTKDMEGSFSHYEWSKDCKNIVAIFRKKDQKVIDMMKDEKKKKLGIVSREITKTFYKFDSAGYLPEENEHLWIIDFKTGKGKQLTDDNRYREWEPSLSPDGKEIVFCSNRSKDPDLEPENVDLYIFEIKTKKIRKLDTPLGDKGMPKYSPDGKYIAYYAQEGIKWYSLNNLWIVPAKGGDPKNLTETFQFDIAGWTINDIAGTTLVTPPTWDKEGKRIYFPVAWHGSSVIKSIDFSGDPETLQQETEDGGVSAFFQFDQNFEKMVYFKSTLYDPGQLWVKDLIKNREKKLTKINESWLKKVDLGEIEEVWFKGKSKNDLQGWIIKPPHFDSEKKYPSILEIHGGPRVQYGNSFMHEFFYLAAQGYVVYYTNPRGGQGYGEKHSAAIWNNWGTVDYDDLMSWNRYISKLEYIDKKNMGVTGGSYGGYMTNWIIGHTKKFKAAVTQRSVSNLISMYGSSDGNWIFQREFGDVPPWEDYENYWRQSPLKYIGNAKTPTLVIHSEQDLRCDQEQGEQIYVALKKLGIDTKFVLFPNESHGLSRGGRTDRRIIRLSEIKNWFDKYMKR